MFKILVALFLSFFAAIACAAPRAPACLSPTGKPVVSLSASQQWQFLANCQKETLEKNCLPALGYPRTTQLLDVIRKGASGALDAQQELTRSCEEIQSVQYLRVTLENDCPAVFNEEATQVYLRQRQDFAAGIFSAGGDPLQHGQVMARCQWEKEKEKRTFSRK